MNLQNRHFLSIKEVSNIIGISVSTINRQVEKGTFPPKHKLSKKGDYNLNLIKKKIETDSLRLFNKESSRG